MDQLKSRKFENDLNFNDRNSLRKSNYSLYGSWLFRIAPAEKSRRKVFISHLKIVSCLAVKNVTISKHYNGAV